MSYYNQKRLDNLNLHPRFTISRPTDAGGAEYVLHLNDDIVLFLLTLPFIYRPGVPVARHAVEKQFKSLQYVLVRSTHVLTPVYTVCMTGLCVRPGQWNIAYIN